MRRNENAPKSHAVECVFAPVWRGRHRLQHIAETWGDYVCDTVAAFVSPASLQCGDAEVVRYVGYAAFALLVVVAVWLGAKVLSARPH